MYKSQPARYSFESLAYEQVQLISVTQGVLFCKSREWDVSKRLEAGQFTLLRRDGSFRLWCESRGYSGVGVSLLGSVDVALTGTLLTGTLDNRLRVVEALLRAHMDAPLPESAAVLQGLGMAFVWEAVALLRDRSVSSKQDWSAAARTALDLNRTTGISVRRAWSSLPISYRQACRCFRERFKMSPKTYQEASRVAEAQRLLKDSMRDITSIATELGYASSQHFASRFRALTGKTPTAYRNTCRGKGHIRNGNA